MTTKRNTRQVQDLRAVIVDSKDSDAVRTGIVVYNNDKTQLDIVDENGYLVYRILLTADANGKFSLDFALQDATKQMRVLDWFKGRIDQSFSSRGSLVEIMVSPLPQDYVNDPEKGVKRVRR